MRSKPLSVRTRILLGCLSIAIFATLYLRIAEWKYSGLPNALAQAMHPAQGTRATQTTMPGFPQMMEGLGSQAAVQASGKRPLVEDAKASGEKLLWGLLLGVSMAIAIGLLMGYYQTLEAFLLPPLSIFAKVPATAALAIYFVAFGFEWEFFVAMVAFGIFPTLAQVVYLAVREVPVELLYKARTLGASGAEMVWRVVLPHTMPKILDGIRLQIGPALIYLIAAELVVGSVGFGCNIRLAFKRSDMSTVFPYLAILAAFGFLADYGLRWARDFCCPWYNAE